MNKILAIALCCVSLAAHSDRLYFTSELYTDYAHTVARLLVQKLHTDAYRTVGNIHLEEVQERNGNKRLLLWVNGVASVNYQYSLARRNYLPEDKVASSLIARLVADKKAVGTK